MGVNSFVAMVMKHKIFKAGTVPFTLRAKVECELDRLARDGVLEKVPYCDWGAPIVAVRGLQSDSQPHRTVPLLKPEDILATLSGGQLFLTLDLTHT